MAQILSACADLFEGGVDPLHVVRVETPVLRAFAQVEVPPERAVERTGDDELRAQPVEPFVNGRAVCPQTALPAFRQLAP